MKKPKAWHLNLFIRCVASNTRGVVFADAYLRVYGKILY